MGSKVPGMDDTGPASRTRRPGRRSGDSGTRDAILDAALELFAERGFDGASVRAIAARAGVDPGLIRHFFGDKESLFIATVGDRTLIPERMSSSYAGDPHQAGRRITENYLRMWDEPATRPLLLAVVRSASTSQLAVAMMRDMLGARISETTGLAPDDPRMQSLALAASHLLGVAFARHVVQLPALVALDRDALVDLIAPTVQRYLDDLLATAR